VARPSFHKQRPAAGARPGTLAIPADSPPPRIHVSEYSPDGLREVDVSAPEDLRRYVNGDHACWIDVQGLGDEAVLRKIAEVFAIHPLALEDAVNVPQRAKSEIYDKHQLVVARIPQVEADGTVRVPQVCFLIAQRYLLTFQERYLAFFEPVRERLRAGIGPMRSMGPDYLAYAMIDTLVDRYFPIAEGLSNQLEQLEDEVGDAPTPEILSDIHSIRRQLVVLRRVGRPQREAVNALAREQTPFVSDQVRIFLRDTCDHIAQIMELVDSTHELAVGLSEPYLSSVSHRSNEVMKVLTLMASIFIPLTFIAGVYGMNFEYMPELGKPQAYFYVLGLMLLVAIAMILYFRHRGWIGTPQRVRRRRGACGEL
jgi:magnesium transporter